MNGKRQNPCTLITRYSERMMEECVYAHYGRHGMKSIQWVLCAVTLVGTTGLGHTKESNPASSEDQAVSKLDAPPVDIVRRFCQLDFDGARLRSAEGDPIWQLTNNSGEPPNNPVSLTTTWDVAETSLGEKDATVVVKYQIVGVVEESPQGPILHRYRRTTSKTFYISKSIDGWKIRLDKLALPPYVSLTAYQRHIDDLLKQPAPDSSGADSYTQTLFRLR